MVAAVVVAKVGRMQLRASVVAVAEPQVLEQLAPEHQLLLEDFQHRPRLHQRLVGKGDRDQTDKLGLGHSPAGLNGVAVVGLDAATTQPIATREVARCMALEAVELAALLRRAEALILGALVEERGDTCRRIAIRAVGAEALRVLLVAQLAVLVVLAVMQAQPMPAEAAVVVEEVAPPQVEQVEQVASRVVARVEVALV